MKRPTPVNSSLRSLLTRVLPRGALLLSVLTFASYAMGLVRDRIFAQTYGAGIDLDAYNAAFQIPELALDVLVASGLVAPFIPIFTGLRAESDEAAERFARTVLTAAVLVMSVAVALLFLFAPQTAAIAAPGFDAAERALYVDLFRVMCITPVIFAASITLGEVLVARQRFLFYGLAPVLYNAGIVLGTVLLAGTMGIFAAAIGAIVGALLHLGIRIIGIARTDVRFRPSFAFREGSFVGFVRLMVPKMVSHPIEPMLFLFFTAVATTLGEGSVSSLSFARNFQSVPVVLIGVSFSLAVFPSLSAAWAAGDRAGYLRIVTTNVATIAALTVAAAIGLAVVGELAIRVLLGGGAFDAEDIERTALILAAFAISVPFDALAHPLSRAIYATKNTILQVLASLVGLATTVGATLLLVDSAGILAIPFGFAIGAAVKVAALTIALGFRLRATRPMAAEPRPPSG